MNQLLSGAVAMAALTIAVFFLRFWRRTGDRFFLFFSLAFGLQAINRSLQGLQFVASENEPIFYIARLLSFVLILIAIVGKNRSNNGLGRPV